MCWGMTVNLLRFMCDRGGALYAVTYSSLILTALQADYLQCHSDNFSRFLRRLAFASTSTFLFCLGRTLYDLLNKFQLLVLEPKDVQSI
jgi:hypothetical protein